MTAEDLTRLGEFARYKDVDGDAIPYRTLPGTDHPQASFFTRGSGHNEKALYTERPDDYQNLMERLDRKFDTARKLVPAPVVVANGNSKVGIIAFGTTDFAVTESRDQLKKEYGVETDYLRIRAYPFTREIHDFVASHERIYVIEQNRDAQMLSLLKLDLPRQKMQPNCAASATSTACPSMRAPSPTNWSAGGDLKRWRPHPPLRHRSPPRRPTASACLFSSIAAARPPLRRLRP